MKEKRFPTTMSVRNAPRTFRFATIATVLTLASVLLLATVWWVIPIFFKRGVECHRAIAWAALVVWASSLVGIVPVALLHRRGLLPTVHGYFLGAAIRVVVCILATVIAVRSDRVPAGPWVTTLLGMYLPLLFLEVALVGRSIWDRPADLANGSLDAGSRCDAQGNVFVETLR